MTDFNMNSQQDAVTIFDSFIQLQSGSDRYRLKSAQNYDPRFAWPNLDRVADDATVFLTQVVSGHRVDIDTTLTADEVDTASPPTNTRTVSYYIYQKSLRKHVLVSVSCVYYAKDSTSNNYLRLNFTFELEEVSMPRLKDSPDGAVTLRLSGRIITISPIDSSDLTPTFIRGSS